MTLPSLSNADATLIVFCASIIELVAASILCDDTDCSDNYIRYAVVVGAVASFITLVMIILVQIGKDVGDTVHAVVSCILLVWWSAGAGVLTFKRPFVVTSETILHT